MDEGYTNNYNLRACRLLDDDDEYLADMHQGLGVGRDFNMTSRRRLRNWKKHIPARWIVKCHNMKHQST